MTIIKICTVIFISFCSSMVVKQLSSPLKAFIPIATFAVISISVLPCFFTEFNEVLTQFESSRLSEYILLISKALGISFLCTATSEICVTCGESMLAELSIFAGKTEILILSLPLVSSLLDISRSLV